MGRKVVDVFSPQIILQYSATKHDFSVLMTIVINPVITGKF